MKRPTQGPTEAEIARSQASIAAVLGADEVAKLEAETFDDPPATADPSQPSPEPAPEPFDPLREWFVMDTARKDGKPLWLRGPDGEAVEATWRQSRRIVNTPKGYAWEEYFTWTAILGGLVPFEPVGWRPSTGAPHP